MLALHLIEGALSTKLVQSGASHATPTQLSPGGDRADIWGEGEEKKERFASGDFQSNFELGREKKGKERRDRFCEISSQTLSFNKDAGPGKGFSR